VRPYFTAELSIWSSQNWSSLCGPMTGTPVRSADFVGGAGMIEMAVREPHLLQRQAEMVERAHQRVDIAAGIDSTACLVFVSQISEQFCCSGVTGTMRIWSFGFGAGSFCHAA
jgi:hypothetical protein